MCDVYKATAKKGGGVFVGRECHTITYFNGRTWSSLRLSHRIIVKNITLSIPWRLTGNILNARHVTLQLYYWEIYRMCSRTSVSVKIRTTSMNKAGTYIPYMF